LAVPAAEAQFRGELISVERVDQVAAEDLIPTFSSLLPEVPEILFRIFLRPRFDIDAYRVVYGTIDAIGNPTVASMLVVAPSGHVGPAPLVTYHHGTVADDASVPSNLGYEAYIGYALAAEGYLAVMPDYLGFGASPIPHHPYVHAATEASAAIDAMRAARTGAVYLGLALNGQVFLTGYSQGGHACVATMREIEANHRNEFNLVFTAAGSGPYDLDGIQANMALSNGAYPTPGYFPLLMLGYQDVYGNLFSSYSEALVAPYDTILPPAFNRVNTLGQINRLFPDDWRDVIQPAYLQGVLQDRRHPVNQALADNDLLDFVPRTPLHMYYCTGDTQVDYRNSLLAWFYYKILRRSPADVRAVRIGPFAHTECAPYALILGKLQMDLRRTD
jgi:hypothetical protein